MTITIIVPIYNVEKFLPRCVDSILRQTYENLEIILVDDGSTDSSGAICDGYCEKDGRVKVIHQSNARPSAARNAGIDAAAGEWLGFVDADDYIEETMFEELLNAAVSGGKKLAACGFSKLFQNSKVIDRTCPEIPARLSTGEALPYLLSQRYFCGFMCNKLFSREIFDSGWRNDTNLYFLEDLPFVLQILLEIDGLAYVPKSLYYYVMHDAASTRKFNKGRLDELTARRQIVEIAAPISKRLEVLSKAWYSASAMGLIYLVSSTGTKHEKKELLPMLRKEARKYKSEYFRSDDFSLSQRVFHILSYLSPSLCRLLRRILKR